MRHPAGDVPGSRTHPGTAVDAAAAGIDGLQIDSDVPPLVKQQINLDASEIFAQLTAVTSLVQVAPRSGLFYSAVNVSEGVVRLFREWLIERDSIGDGKGKRRVDGGPLGMDEEGVLWVNDGMNVGVRFGVRERKWRRADANPVLIRADEDVAISYEIEIRGKSIRKGALSALPGNEPAVAFANAFCVARGTCEDAPPGYGDGAVAKGSAKHRQESYHHRWLGLRLSRTFTYYRNDAYNIPSILFEHCV